MIQAIKRHKVRAILVVMLFGGFLGHYEYKMPKRNFADFHVNYYTAQRIIKHQNPYDVEAYRKEKIANFKYPPLVALVFYPLGFLPQNAAAVTWFTFNFILLVLFFWLCRLAVFDKNSKEKYVNWAYFLTILASARCILYNFDEGQVNILMMFAMGAGLYCLRQKKELLAGALIAFSSLVKYMSAIVLPYFSWKKRLKFIAYFLVFILVFSLLPAVFLGWSYNSFLQKSFLPQVVHTSLDPESVTNHQNQSLLAMLGRFLTDYSYECHINFMHLYMDALQLIFVVFCILLLMPIFIPSNTSKNLPVRQAGNRFEDVANEGVLFLLVPLFNPNGWIHGFIFLIFPYFVCISYLFMTKLKDKTVLALTFFSFTLAMWPDVLFPTKAVYGYGVNPTQVYSLLTFGTILLYMALLKIKFKPTL